MNSSVPTAARPPRLAALPLQATGTTVTVPTTGEYDLWASGSVRGKLAAVVDGREVASIRHQLNYAGQYSPLGRVVLTAGTHTVEGRQSLSRLRPGESGAAWSVGPVLVTSPGRCG